jgi:hypothetical protein
VRHVHWLGSSCAAMQGPQSSDLQSLKSGKVTLRPDPQTVDIPPAVVEAVRAALRAPRVRTDRRDNIVRASSADLRL